MFSKLVVEVKLTIPLPVHRFSLVFEADAASTEAAATPAFAGNAWRGALGHSLRALACLTGAAACDGCFKKPQCAYNYLWETPPPPDATRMRLYPQAPHPFVLRVLEPDAKERQLSAGQPKMAAGADNAGNKRTLLLLTLVGRAEALLPLLVQALAVAARSEYGVAGQQHQLCEVRQEQTLGALDWLRIDGKAGLLSPQPGAAAVVPPAPPASAGPLRLLLHTPLRIKREGRAIAPQDLVFADFFGSLLRRISMLCAFHTSSPLEAPFAELMQKARLVAMQKSELSWERQQRFSNRQKQAMKMDGLVGWFELNAADVADFWPYLWLGQFVHAGSAATMGLGCYLLAAPSAVELAPPGLVHRPASLPTITAAA